MKIQTFAALFLVIASAATVLRRSAWLLATLAVTSFSATLPLLGHAAGSKARMALHVAHIFAAGLWLGTLAIVVLMGVRSKINAPSNVSVSLEDIRLTILRHFAPLAMSGCSVVVAAGIVIAYLYVGSVSNLWTSLYGRVLILKVALVGGVSVSGFTNWRRLRAGAGGRSARSTIWIETALALAVMIVTGFLTEVSHPE